MAEEHIGSLISIECLGGSVYQGRIRSVDPTSQAIQLERAFLNGKPIGVPTVTLTVAEISDLRILKESSCFVEPSIIAAPKPNRPRAPQNNGAASPVKRLPNKPNNNVYRPQGIAITTSDLGILPAASKKPSPPQQQNNSRRSRFTRPARSEFFQSQSESPYGWQPVADALTHGSMKPKGMADHPCGIPQLDEAAGVSTRKPIACGNEHLNSIIDRQLMETDFDFEANLALFDKQKVFGESTGRSSAPTRNFRHDENIVADVERVYSWTDGRRASPSPSPAQQPAGTKKAAGDAPAKVAEVSSTATQPAIDGQPRIIAKTEAGWLRLPAVCAGERAAVLEDAVYECGASLLAANVARSLVHLLQAKLPDGLRGSRVLLLTGAWRLSTQTALYAALRLANGGADDVFVVALDGDRFDADLPLPGCVSVLCPRDRLPDANRLHAVVDLTNFPPHTPPGALPPIAWLNALDHQTQVISVDGRQLHLGGARNQSVLFVDLPSRETVAWLARNADSDTSLDVWLCASGAPFALWDTARRGGDGARKSPLLDKLFGRDSLLVEARFKYSH